jgi:hypothetical protein
MHQAASCIVVGLLVVAACSRPLAPAGTNALVAGALATSKGPIAKADACDSIAEAGCDREARCNRIGEGRYGSADSCKADMRSRAKQRIAAAPCSNGVDRAKLDDCISALGSERCDETAFGFDASLACQTLCRP